MNFLKISILISFACFFTSYIKCNFKVIHEKRIEHAFKYTVLQTGIYHLCKWALPKLAKKHTYSTNYTGTLAFNPAEIIARGAFPLLKIIDILQIMIYGIGSFETKNYSRSNRLHEPTATSIKKIALQITLWAIEEFLRSKLPEDNYISLLLKRYAPYQWLQSIVPYAPQYMIALVRHNKAVSNISLFNAYDTYSIWAPVIIGGYK